MTRAVLIGAAGRMGRALMAACAEARVTVSGAIVRPGAAVTGHEAAGPVPLTCDLPAALAQADVAIDFSRPEAASGHLAACVAARRPLLLGTTGLPAALHTELAAAAQVIPLLVAPNTSLGVALLVQLTRIAARALPPDFDIEIIEAHHRHKRDAPSGTALSLGAAAASGRETGHGRACAAPPPPGTARVLPRVPGEIGYAVVRGGNIAGEHTVLLAGEGEEVLLTHRATDRMIFARGAIRAALWLRQQAPGNYTMQDLFQLNQ